VNSTLRVVAIASIAVVTACGDDGGSGSATPDTGVDDAATDTAEDTAGEDTADGGEDATEDTTDEDAADADAADAADAEDAAPWLTDDVCTPEPLPGALLQSGATDGDVRVAPGGRGLATPGTTLEVDGYPSSAVFSADGSLVYVASLGRQERILFVIDVATGDIVQELELDDLFVGLERDDANGWLYATGGAGNWIERFEIAEDGTLTALGRQDIGVFAGEIELSADGSRLYVGSFRRARLFEIDTALWGTEDAVLNSFRAGGNIWDVALVESTGEVWTTTLEGDVVTIHDLDGDPDEPTNLELGSRPAGMTLSDDESTMWIVLNGDDAVIEVDVATREIVATSTVTVGDLLDDDGEELGRTNAQGIALSSDGATLYVSRGNDNAITVLSTDPLAVTGAIPTAWWPGDVALAPDDGTLVIPERKGFGAGPNPGQSTSGALSGSIGIVPLSDLDLEATTADHVAWLQRAQAVFPFDCDGFFPIPRELGDPTPIEHVILIVKENKTFDCVFGDLVDMDVDVDPSLVRWGEEYTPNQHEVARTFTISDNFYTEVDNSDMGHVTLTAGVMTEWMERMWVESKRSTSVQGYQVADPTIPSNGNFYTHLLDNGVDIQVYGEIVGMLVEDAEGREVIQFSDPLYPGGPFYSYAARDADRARYIVDQANENGLATFTFALFPNDHTGGVTPGNPTPEAQVADNDLAVGLLIEGISNSEYWDNTVIIVLQDDPQGCSDHVDAHRSFLLVASPWARRGYVSHVNASFQSVFATITRILGVPPMGRHDAAASPLWDMFTGVPDFTPFEAVPRQIPESKILDMNTPGIDASLRMDFRGPDRNENLGVVLDNYRLWQMGELTAEEAEARIAAGLMSVPAGVEDPDEWQAEHLEEREEEAEEELSAHDIAWSEYTHWLRERGEPVPMRYGAPLPEARIRAVLDGDIAPWDLRRFGP